MESKEDILEQEMDLLDLSKNRYRTLNSKKAYLKAQDYLNKFDSLKDQDIDPADIDNDNYVWGVYYLYVAELNGRKTAGRDLDKWLMTGAKACIEPLMGYDVFAKRPDEHDPIDIYESIYAAVQETNSEIGDPLLISQDSIICFPHYLYYYLDYIKNEHNIIDHLPPFYVLTVGSYLSHDPDNQCVLDFLMTNLHQRLENFSGEERKGNLPKLGMPADSAYLVALSLYHGINIKRDVEAAITWFLYAAIVGSVKAYLFISVSFANFASIFRQSRCNILNILGNAYNLLNEMDFSYHVFLIGVGANLSGEIRTRGKTKSLTNEVIYNFLVTLRANVIYFNDNFYDTDIQESAVILKTQDLIVNAVNTFAKQRDDDLGAILASFFIFNDPLASIVVKDVIDRTAALQLVKNSGPEHCFKFYIKDALKHGHPLALETYCNYLLIHRQVKKSSIKYFERLLEYGFARECFELAGFFYEGNNDIEKDMTKLNFYMKKAADLGYGMAQFNLSLDTGRTYRDRSIFYAFKSLQRNIVVAYHSLFECLKGENKTKELAHTCLRMAAEYNYPPALKTISELRKTGEYRPFAYIREIEKIESLADTNVSACIVMFLIYSESNILPENRYRANHYLQKASEHGSQIPFALYYLQEKKKNKLYERNTNCVLPSFERGSKCLAEFFNASGIDSIKFDDDLAIPLTALIQNLIKNDHFLAYNALVSSFENGFWNNMLNKTARAKVQEIIDQKRALWPDFYAMYQNMFPIEHFGLKGLNDCLAQYSDNLSTLNQTTQDNSTIYLIKAMICLRPLAAAADLKKARGFFARSMNSGSSEALSLAFMSYDVIDDCAQLHENSAAEKIESDMFVESLVEQ